MSISEFILAGILVWGMVSGFIIVGVVTVHFAFKILDRIL